MFRLLILAAAVVAPVIAIVPPARPPVTPVPHAPTGRIQGTVEISTALSARRPQFRIYSEPGPGATPPPPPAAPREQLAAELHNVVIYLDGPLPGSDDLPIHHAVMAQRDERFVPHVLPVLQGTVVDFPNEDDLYHNVFSLSATVGKGGFDLGRYPKGQSKSWTFDKPGTVKVFCHIHSDMTAVVLVLQNPFFASPDDSHRFSIDDVPEGDYTIVGWHERIKPVVRHVHVTAGQTSTIDFNIPLPQGGGR